MSTATSSTFAEYETRPKAQEKGMRIFQERGASVHYRELVTRSGLVVEMVFYGPFSHDDAKTLRTLVLREVKNSSAYILRMENAVPLMTELEVPPREILHAAPAAFVTRAEHYEMYASYARSVAQLGIMRAVFLDSELLRARAWAERCGADRP